MNDSKTITVLLIEDNPGDARLTMELLSESQERQFQIEWVDYLMDGLARVKQKRYDVILLDLGTPDSGGLQTFQMVYERVPDTPIVVLTGLNDLEIALAAVQAGAQDYLVKDDLDTRLLIRAVTYAVERKNANRALRESDEKFKALYENVPLSYQSLDQNGCYIDVNPTWLTTLGYARDEVIGQWFGDFLHPDWKPNFEKNFPEFKKRGYVRDVQFKIRHKEGYYLDISFEGCVGYNSDGSFRQTYCVFKDITEQKKIEQEQHQYTKKIEALNAALLNIPATLSQDDVLQKILSEMQSVVSSDSSAIFIREADGLRVVSDFGISQSLIGSSFSDENLLFNEIITTEEPLIIDNPLDDPRFENWAGSQDIQSWMGVPLIFQEEILGIMTLDSYSENTYHPDQFLFVKLFAVQAAQAIHNADLYEKSHQSAARLQLVMDATQDGFFDWDMQTNEIVFNAAYFEMLGYEPDEFPHTFETYRKLAHPEDLKRSEEKLLRYFSGESDDTGIEMRFKTKSGDWKWLFSRGKLVERDEDGQPVRFVGTNVDITERKKMELDIRHQRDRAQTYLDIAGVMFIALDKNGKIILANQKASQILQFPAEDLLGKDWFDNFIPEPFRAEVKAVFQQLMRAEIEPVEFYENPVVTAAGEERLIAWHNSVFRDEENTIIGIISSGEDITQQKQAGENLRASQNLLRSYIDHAPYGIFIADAEGFYVDVNLTAEALTGYSRDELLGMHLSKLIAPEDQDLARQSFATVTKTGITNQDTRFVRKDGRVGYWNVSGVKISADRFLGFVHEITDRVQAVDALQRSEHRYRAIYEQAAVGVSEVESQTGKFLRANQRYCEIVGYSQAELQAIDFMQLTHPEDLPADLENMKRLIAGEINEFSMEKRQFRKDGSTVWIQLTVSPTWLPGEEPTYHIAVIEDITERKQAEEALQRSEAQHKTAQRVAQIGHWELDAIDSVPVWSDEIFRIFGLEPGVDEPSFTEHDTIIHPDEWPLLEQAVKAGFEDGQPFDLVFRILRPGDQIGWMHAIGAVESAADGRVIKMFGTAQDITLQKQAEQEIKERQAFLTAIFENSLNGIMVADDAGNYTLVNQAAAEMFGYSIEELQTMNVGDLRTVEEPGAAARYQKYLETGRDIGEFDFIHNLTGEARITQYYAVRVKENFNLSVMSDITARKLAEESLRISETKNKAILEAIPDLMFILSEEGEHLEFYAPNTDQLFVQPTDFIGKRVDEVLPPEVSAQYQEFIQKALAGEETQIFEYALEFEKSDQRYYEARLVNNENQTVLAIVREITEAKMAEETLQESEALLNQAQQVAHLGSWMWDIASNQLEWSDEMFRIFGIDQEGFSGHLPDVITQAIHPDDREKVEQSNRSTIEDKTPIPVEYRIIRPDGTERVMWAEAGELILTAEGHPARLTGIVQDITERKQAEEELKRRIVEIERMNEMYIGREGRMLDLKQEVNTLLQEFGKPPKYQAPAQVERLRNRQSNRKD